MDWERRRWLWFVYWLGKRQSRKTWDSFSIASLSLWQSMRSEMLFHIHICWTYRWWTGFIYTFYLYVYLYWSLQKFLHSLISFQLLNASICFFVHSRRCIGEKCFDAIPNIVVIVRKHRYKIFKCNDCEWQCTEMVFHLWNWPIKSVIAVQRCDPAFSIWIWMTVHISISPK